MVPNSLGPAELLLHYGTDEQRQRYLPSLAKGDDIPCFALTGPYAGSDAGGMTDVGIVCKGEWEGREVLGLRLTWEKRYITLGPVATLLGLAFKCHDPDHLLGDEEDLGITLALIPTDTPGVEIGRRHVPLGAAFMNGPNSGKDVFVPLEYIIGGQEMIGKGWMMLMNCLSVGRSISLPAVGTSAGKASSYVSGRYAQVREQFNVPIARMIFGQGAIRCHPYVLKEMELAQREDKDQAAREFDALLVKHIGFAVGNAASSFLLSLSCGHLGNAPGDRISRPYFRALNRLAASFALLADFSMMLLGGELKRKERLSARLGDVLSYLYLGSAALKRYHDLGNPDYLHPLLRWAMEENLGKAEAALEDLLNNFPSRFFGCALKVLVLPFGRRHKGPGDELDAEIAEILGRPDDDPALQAILAGAFLPKDPQDPVGALAHAFDAVRESAALEKTLHKAIKEGRVQPQAGQNPIDAGAAAGVLSAEQAQALHQAEAARRKVIDVDDFAKEELQLADGRIR